MSLENTTNSTIDQGDFGYVKQQREEITHMCEPINQVIFHYTEVNDLYF